MVSCSSALRTRAKHTSETVSSWLSRLHQNRGRTRGHVVSESLCDDVLERLGPSLPAKNTCDLVDLHPGTCLWSEKLHEVIQPRRHILVEPEREQYSKFLQPLLDRPNSRYEYASSLSAVLYQDKSMFEGQGSEARNEATANLNSHLLITANLTDLKSRSTYGYNGVFSGYFLYAYYSSMFSCIRGMHRHGLVRLLAWLPDSEKNAQLPRTVHGRNRQSVQTEMTCKVAEIAGGLSYHHRPLQQRRNYPLDLESQEAVAVRQTSNSVKHPPGRELPPLPPPIQHYGPSEEDLLLMSLPPRSPSWVGELLDLEARAKAGEFGTYQQNPTFWYTQAGESEQVQAFRRHVILGRRRKSLRKQYLESNEIVQERRQMTATQMSRLSSSAYSTRLAGVEARIQRMSDDNRNYVLKSVDDYRAFDSNPPTLLWDTRDAEPMLVSEEDCFPRKPLALLDFQPKTEFLSRLDTDSKRLCFDVACSSLFNHRSKPIEQALSRLVPGGLEEFMARVPSLESHIGKQVPFVDRLRVRGIPTSTMMDIALAWESWPFRPSTDELFSNTQSGAAPAAGPFEALD